MPFLAKNLGIFKMKVTVVGQWICSARYVPGDIRGNLSATVFVSNSVNVDDVVVTALFYANRIYVFDHAKKRIQLLDSPRDVLTAVNHGAPGTRYKILKTVDIDESALEDYDAFVRAVNAAN